MENDKNLNNESVENMKPLKQSDLTPQIMKDLMQFKTREEVRDYFGSIGFEVGLGSASKILNQIRKAAQLSDDSLANVAGGWCSEDWDCEWDYSCYSRLRGGIS